MRNTPSLKRASSLNSGEVTRKEALQLELVRLRPLERVGQCRAQLVLDGHRSPVDRDGRGLLRGVELHLTVELSGLETLFHVVQPQQGRDRHLYSRGNASVRRDLDPFPGFHGCRERGTDAGPAVAVSQAPNIEFRRLDEINQAKAAPVEFIRADGNRDLAEGERVRTLLDHHACAVGTLVNASAIDRL